MIAAELTINGRRVRFGPDEESEGDILGAPEWSTQIPGGFGTGSFTVSRPGWIGSSETPLLSRVRIYDTEVGYTLYEGIVRGKPQASADAISIQTEGLVTSLEHDVPFNEVYVDRDLGRWGPLSRTERLRLLGGTSQISEPVTNPDASGTPSLQMTLTSPWAARADCQAMYDAGSSRIAKIYYSLAGLAGGGAALPSGFDFIFWIDSNDHLTGGADATSGDLWGGSSVSGYYTPSSQRRFAFADFHFGSADSANREVTLLAQLAVYGNHGLALYGAADGGPDGVLGSDVIKNVLARKCPLIEVEDSNIEASSYVIPHLVFVGEESAQDVIKTVTLLGGAASVPNDWGVYEDGFFWRQPGTYGRTWRVRRDQYADTTKEGPDASERFNAAFVKYTDGAGTEKSVGPPGSGADTETSDLEDTNPDNPVNRAGIPRKTIIHSVGITDSDGATLIGRLILAEASRLNRKGSVTVSGTAKTDEGNEYPASMIRAGDQVVIEDDPDPEPLPVNSTGYSHDSMQLRANVGAVPDSLEVLLSQSAAAQTNF